MSELHKNTFWLYGTILALAVREPLTHVIPRLIEPGFTDWQVQLEAWRLFLLLILIVRFYLGAGLYFDEVYVRQSFQKKSYPIDFLSGLLHFLFFFACAVTLPMHQKIAKIEVTYFLVALSLIILYDNVWFAATTISKFDTIDQIRQWSHFNNLTFIVSAGTYVGTRFFFGKDPVFSEHIAILPVLLFSTYDIKQLVAKFEVSPTPTTAIALPVVPDSTSPPRVGQGEPAETPPQTATFEKPKKKGPRARAAGNV